MSFYHIRSREQAKNEEGGGGVKMAPRETENNAYAKFWGNKQRALWYVMVFSGVVNTVSVIVMQIRLYNL